MTPPKKSSGDGAGKGRSAKGRKPAEQETGDTSEYELGDDFLADLDEGGEEDGLAAAADEGLAGDELDGAADEADEGVDDGEEVDDLDELIHAETQEWSPADLEGEAATRVEPQATAPLAVATAADDDRGGSRLRYALGAPWRRLRRFHMPLWARFATASFLIIASTAAATSASTLLYLTDIAEGFRHNGELDKLRSKIAAVEPGEAQTMLIVGSDLRPEFQDVKNFRGLSDTTMLMRLDPNRDAIALFSLPRDLKVQIPGYGTNKLNAAYAYGGPELTFDTIKLLTMSPELPNGIEINHVVNIDFEGFARAVNAIGCVYVDVDRRYAHTNSPNDGIEDYEEIDLKQGYQALCGFDALDYARYRHTDNDVVRAARQQDFLREARQKIPPEKLFSDRRELIEIFQQHTTSDINDAATMLDVIRLFLAARDKPVREIHFEGTLGPSYVTATEQEIDTAVNQFLGIEDTPGTIGDQATIGDASTGAEAQAEAGGAPASGSPGKKKKRSGPSRAPSSEDNLTGTSYGKQLARAIRAKKVKLPIYYPTVLESGTDYAEKPRVYKINGTGEGAPEDAERAAYKWVFSRPALGEYYGFMATRWTNPPILNNPSEEREIGGRTYKFFYDGDRLRLVAWQTDEGSFWVSNTLVNSLSNREMLDIAKGFEELPPLSKK